MSGRPALIRQREAKQIINAAKQAGAKQVEFQIEGVPVIVRLDDAKPKERARPGSLADAIKRNLEANGSY
jgi:sialic acid synthase SpsE